MTTLIYRLSDFSTYPQLILLNTEEDGSHEAKFVFQGFSEGELRLGERSLKLSGGVAQVKFSPLEEGEISPKLITDSRIYTLAPLELCGGNLKSRERLSATVIELRAALQKAYKSIAAMDERICLLEQKIGLSNTFKL